MSTSVVTPTEVADPFNGQEVSGEEYVNYRLTGELPERFKTVEQKTEPPAPTGETVEGQEPSEAEQETGKERDEHGKFKAKEDEALFSPEQQKAFDRAFRKREAKLRREYEDRLAQASSNTQATDPAKEPENADESSEPKRPELPKLADYQGTIEEYDKEVAEYPAKLQAFLDAQRQTAEKQTAFKKRLETSEKAAKKAHPDYAEEFDKLQAEIQAGEEVGLPAHVLQAIAEDADDPHELTYHLITNRDEWQRFTNLSPKEALREVLKLEAKMQVSKDSKEPAPVKKEAKTKAPAPPDPVGARPVVAAFDVNDEKLSAEEWREKREAQLAKRRA